MTDTTSHQTTSLESIIQTHNINTTKPGFPVNTLRILYLIIIETLGENQQLGKTMLTLIPLLQKVVDERTDFKLENPQSNVQEEWEAIQNTLQPIYQVINTPKIHGMFEYLFSYVFQLQDNLLLSLSQDLTTKPKLTPQDLYTTLHIRAMDSVIYSTVLGELLTQSTASVENFVPSIHRCINLSYQINDIVDAVIHAKEDTESGNFSPIEIIKKSATTGDEAKEMITSTLTNLQEQIPSASLPDSTQKLVNEFITQLVGVVR